jgi:glucose 1-dehydrogenase
LNTLAGKVSIITGGAQGIGRAIANRFAAEGAQVIIGDIDVEKAHETAQELKKLHPNVIAMGLDVTIKSDMDELIHRVMEQFGKIDILVNNAAIVTRESFLELSEQTWEKTLSVNLKGPFLCSQAFSKCLIESHGKGKIINFASICSVVINPHATLCAYEVSKAGIVMLTKRMAFELAPYGINVNAIAPSIVKTRLLQPQNEEKLLAHLPIGRIAEPDDITGTVLFLASNGSDYITGTTVFVDGGWLIH